LVVLGVVSFGAEVIADGSIHVYGPLRGRAIAGACGDRQARIFALSMQPQLVSIAGNWRTLEEGSFPEVAGKMAQVRLEGERLLLEPLRG
jgi:septum site-determining protein MinC